MCIKMGEEVIKTPVLSVRNNTLDSINLYVDPPKHRTYIKLIHLATMLPLNH